MCCLIFVRFFELYSRGNALDKCAMRQQDNWSIGSHGGVVRPLVLALKYHDNLNRALGMALTHQITTHISENVASAVCSMVPLLLDLIHGVHWEAAMRQCVQNIRLPKITGIDYVCMWCTCMCTVRVCLLSWM